MKRLKCVSNYFLLILYNSGNKNQFIHFVKKMQCGFYFVLYNSKYLTIFNNIKICSELFMLNL